VGKFKDFTGGAPAKSESKKADTSKEAKSEPPAAQAPATGPKKNRVGPSVRRYLAESGLDASSVAGTGPNGMLLKGDILSAMKSGPPKQKKSSAGPEPSAKSASKPDVKQGAQAPSSPAPSSPIPPLSEGVSYTDVPNSQIRKVRLQLKT
jgi:pyruvate dehydrogenase E2 component (dihydrolipoamide acetyltransferase)